MPLNPPPSVKEAVMAAQQVYGGVSSPAALGHTSHSTKQGRSEIINKETRKGGLSFRLPSLGEDFIS